MGIRAAGVGSRAGPGKSIQPPRRHAVRGGDPVHLDRVGLGPNLILTVSSAEANRTGMPFKEAIRCTWIG